jgi:acid phosphatase family membrane protein YuiD
MSSWLRVTLSQAVRQQQDVTKTENGTCPLHKHKGAVPCSHVKMVTGYSSSSKIEQKLKMASTLL